MQFQVLMVSHKSLKAVSDSLENHKIINCIVLSIILDILTRLSNLHLFIKLWMASVYAQKH